MAAVTSIDGWVKDNKRLYLTVIKPLLDSPEFEITSDSVTRRYARPLAVVAKSWAKGSRLNILTKNKFKFQGLTDADLDDPVSVFSKELFDKSASETEASLMFAQHKTYLEKAVEYVKSAQYITNNINSDLGAIVYIGGLSMILLAMHPYHLYVNFAYQADTAQKDTPTLENYYEFFTDPQWVPLVKYTKRMMTSQALVKLMEDITVINGVDMKKGNLTDQQIASVYGKIDGMTDKSHMIRILGIHATKLFIDVYKHD